MILLNRFLTIRLLKRHRKIRYPGWFNHRCLTPYPFHPIFSLVLPPVSDVILLDKNWPRILVNMIRRYCKCNESVFLNPVTETEYTAPNRELSRRHRHILKRRYHNNAAWNQLQIPRKTLNAIIGEAGRTLHRNNGSWIYQTQNYKYFVTRLALRASIASQSFKIPRQYADWSISPSPTAIATTL